MTMKLTQSQQNVHDALCALPWSDEYDDPPVTARRKFTETIDGLISEELTVNAVGYLRQRPEDVCSKCGTHLHDSSHVRYEFKWRDGKYVPSSRRGSGTLSARLRRLKEQAR